MTAGGKKPGDDPLWAALTRSVTPLDKKARLVPDPPKARRSGNAITRRQPRAGVMPDLPDMPVRASAPQPLDNKSRRKIARGTLALDRSIDLHGLTQDAARRLLERAVISGWQAGQRTLLVITGKGGKRFAQRAADLPVGLRRRRDFDMHGGVLKRVVPEWLTSEPLSGYIAGYATADPAHGGDGALYVRLRRKP